MLLFSLRAPYRGSLLHISSTEPAGGEPGQGRVGGTSPLRLPRCAVTAILSPEVFQTRGNFLSVPMFLRDN